MYPLISSPFSVNCFSRLPISLPICRSNVRVTKWAFFQKLYDIYSASHLVSVVHQGWHHLLHSSLHQDTSDHPERQEVVKNDHRAISYSIIPEALSIAINSIESLDDDVVLVQILLQLVCLGCNTALFLFVWLFKEWGQCTNNITEANAGQVNPRQDKRASQPVASCWSQQLSPPVPPCPASSLKTSTSSVKGHMVNCHELSQARSRQCLMFHLSSE